MKTQPGKGVSMRAVIEGLESRELLSLVIDVRLPGGAKQTIVNTVGQIVKLEVWAVVKGSNSSISDEAFHNAFGSFLSHNVGGGAALGTLSATCTAPFNYLGSNNGIKTDLDADTDLDVGSNITSKATGYFFARSRYATFHGSPAPGGGAQFKIADVTFTVSKLLVGTSTELNFRTRTGMYNAAWYEDNKSRNATTGSFSAGTPVVVRNSTPGSIVGTVYEDVNKNGVFDSTDKKLSGWKVFLDTNKNGVLDIGERNSTSDINGHYSFASTRPGGYRVVEIVKAGYHATAPLSGRYDIILLGGQTRALNFGNQLNTPVNAVVQNGSTQTADRLRWVDDLLEMI